MKQNLWLVFSTALSFLLFFICVGCSPKTIASPKPSVPVQASSTFATITPTNLPQASAVSTTPPTSTAQPLTSTRQPPPPSPLPPTPSLAPATPTPRSILVTAKTDVNVRFGPGVHYPVIGILGKGEQRPLLGRNSDGTWWQINHREGNGWVSSFFAEISGPSNNLLPVASASMPPATFGPSTTAPSGVSAYVSRVIDGDTIIVSISGRTYTVRYIGIDTPETVAPGRSVEWMGQEASAANKFLVEGKTVYLEKDVSETDRYGRLLRYVYVGQVFVNAELVRRGYASVSTYPPDVKYQSLLLQMQQEARIAGRGLWGTKSAPVAQPSMAPLRPSNCDQAYPDVCIPSSPPDLDCKDVPYRKFRVLPPDPHRFDGDHDGIGCE